MTTGTARTSRKPLQARAEETRRNILCESRRLFAEKGFDGANTREIAARAGVAHAAIRYHFGTKEQLWQAMVVEMYEGLTSSIRGALEHQDPKDAIEKFETFIHAYVRYCAENPEHARITIAESLLGGDRLTWIVDTFIRGNHEFVAESFANLRALDMLPDLPDLSLIYGLISMCQMPFVLTRQAELIYGTDIWAEQVESHAEAVLALFLCRS